jgi:hypothetical protein
MMLQKSALPKCAAQKSATPSLVSRPSTLRQQRSHVLPGHHKISVSQRRVPRTQATATQSPSVRLPAGFPGTQRSGGNSNGPVVVYGEWLHYLTLAQPFRGCLMLFTADCPPSHFTVHTCFSIIVCANV